MAKLNSLTTSRRSGLLPRASVVALSSALCAMTFVVGMSLFASSPAGADNRLGATYENSTETPGVSSTLDMRDDEYNSEYIFGITKGVAGSTMTPVIKPFFFLVTIPLDIVFLPFAAIGGFF